MQSSFCRHQPLPRRKLLNLDAHLHHDSFAMLTPDHGVQPLVEGHGGDVGDHEIQTMNAELLEDDIRRAQTVEIVARI